MIYPSIPNSSLVVDHPLLYPSIWLLGGPRCHGCYKARQDALASGGSNCSNLCVLSNRLLYQPTRFQVRETNRRFGTKQGRSPSRVAEAPYQIEKGGRLR